MQASGCRLRAAGGTMQDSGCRLRANSRRLQANSALCATAGGPRPLPCQATLRQGGVEGWHGCDVPGNSTRLGWVGSHA